MVVCGRCMGELWTSVFGTARAAVKRVLWYSLAAESFEEVTY